MTSTGKGLLLAVLAILSAGTAQAEPKYNPLKMQCADVQGVIDRQGAVTLRYMSTRVPNLPLYNRYVSSSGYCQSNEVATPANVPTRDNKNCRVNVCEHRDFDDNELLIPHIR